MSNANPQLGSFVHSHACIKLTKIGRSSCNLCRQRKIRCNREVPCSNCIRSRNPQCEFENLPIPPPRPQRSESQETPSITTTAATLNPDIEALGARIANLENHLEGALKRPIRHVPSAPSTVVTPVSSIETAESRIGGTFYIHHGDPALGQSPNMHRSITHKKRMYGQSHWMSLSVTMVKDIAEMIDVQSREPNAKESCEKLFIGMVRCKQMARIIKGQREPPWPCSPSPELPPKLVADNLIDCYLRTHETIYRILHIPSFKRSYEALWTTDAEPDPTFIVQLKLVLAIGAATHDDKFSLRSSAMRWVHEGETWIANPHLKSRLNFQYIQIYCLQLLAREAAAVGEDMVFVSTGTLLRSAIFLGLHRDPVHLPSRTIFANEMHRRIWSTVLEICLQTSLYSGCPPLICTDDFDTQPARNYDDDQIELEDACPKPDKVLTQASISISLRRSFPARLAVVQFLNNFASSGTHEETLHLDSELRLAYKSLRSTLREFTSSEGTNLSDFQLRAMETMMNRYLCALHSPFFMPSLSDTKYAYSRQTVLETSLKMWYAVYPASECADTCSSKDERWQERDDFQRLVTCGHGFFRSAALQSVLMIAVEVRTQLQEEDSLSPTPLRRDLFAVLERAPLWSLECMEAGETNIKGYVFTCLMLGYAQGLASGLDKMGISKSLVEIVGAAEDRGLEVLEKMLERDISEQDQVGTADWSIDVTPDILAEWDPMVSSPSRRP